VAIHGLGGQPINTWTKDEKLWLRDLLPGQLTNLTAVNLRVLSFGYDSAIFGRSSSQIRHYADQLLGALHAERLQVKDVLSQVHQLH
jgi:hypothetical protein